jgi:OmpA-OmpF porin, OOP family
MIHRKIQNGTFTNVLWTVVCGLWTFLSTIGLSQNLVPNPSFESYAICPGSYHKAPGQFQLPGWTSPTIGTPDHFHVCSEGDADVPYNWAGVADPFEGNGYVGLYLWMDEKNYREYIQSRLTETLVKDSVYQIQFFYKLSSYSKYSIDRIGLFLSDSTFTIRNDRPLSVKPTLAIVHDSALTKETGLWEKASWWYKAKGGEQFITIGNFWSDEETKLYNIQFRPVSEPMLATASYYYLDDVQVVSRDYLRKQEQRQVIPDFDLEETRLNTTYILKNIQFAFDSYRLLNPSFRELDQLGEFLLKYPRLKLQLFGHTDDRGSDRYNQRLSELRAKNVADYLVSIGVRRERVEYFGYGKSKPLVNEMTEEAREMNRRVEIRFIE